MVEIQLHDIKKLDYIGSGKFGLVYKKDNHVAYKIYHDKISMRGHLFDNPSLRTPKLHYNNLISRCKNLKYSGGIIDLIYTNHKLSGVVIPFFEGKTLDHVEKPLRLKIDIARQIVRNSKELNKHLIYPTDYKLDNIILDNNIVQLIDLDDVRTHALIYPSILFKILSIRSVKQTVQSLFNHYDHFYLNKKLDKQLTRKKDFFAPNYKSIEKYIDFVEKSKDFTFIDYTTNIDEIKNNEIVKQTNLVYVIDNNINDVYLQSVINNLTIHNLPLFDFVLRNKIDNYDNIEIIKNSYTYFNNNLKKIKRL